jgi:hypothetical protein
LWFRDWKAPSAASRRPQSAPLGRSTTTGVVFILLTVKLNN